jgi:nucleoside phosphorylase
MLVVILCARYEEAHHTRLVLAKAGLNVREVVVNSALHHETEMSDINNNKLQIEIYSTDRMGSPEASIATVQLIIKRKPYWIFMTGVCAGHPKKTALGDVIVAESAVDIRSGKIGPQGIAHDSRVHTINRYLNQFIKSIQEKLETSPDTWNALLTVKRPITRRHKMDAILNLLFSHKSSIAASAGAAAVAASIIWQLLQPIFSHRSRGSIPRSEIQRQMITLCNRGECSDLLDKLVERKEITHDEKEDVFYLNDEQIKQVQKMVQRDVFPKPDPTLPKIVSGVLGTDSLVVANMQSQDWVDLEKELAQRNLVAIEMEASGLYNATAAMNESNNDRNNPITHTILVKGVSDLASPDKDDQFHDYGKQVSAVFVYQFLY